jgi:hypothetical protein
MSDDDTRWDPDGWKVLLAIMAVLYVSVCLIIYTTVYGQISQQERREIQLHDRLDRALSRSSK